MENRLSLPLEFLELLLSAFGLLHFENIEPHSLAQGAALAYHNQVSQFNVPVCVWIC